MLADGTAGWLFVAMPWGWLAKHTEHTLRRHSCMHFGRHSWSRPAPALIDPHVAGRSMADRPNALHGQMMPPLRLPLAR